MKRNEAYHSAIDQLRRCAERQAENPMGPGAWELARVAPGVNCRCTLAASARVEPYQVPADAWERMRAHFLEVDHSLVDFGNAIVHIFRPVFEALTETILEFIKAQPTFSILVIAGLRAQCFQCGRRYSTKHGRRRRCPKCGVRRAKESDR